MSLESELWAPVKALLEAGRVTPSRAKCVAAMSRRCAARNPPVVVELKRVFGLGLVLAGSRSPVTDQTWFILLSANGPSR